MTNEVIRNYAASGTVLSGDSFLIQRTVGGNQVYREAFGSDIWNGAPAPEQNFIPINGDLTPYVVTNPGGVIATMEIKKYSADQGNRIIFGAQGYCSGGLVDISLSVGGNDDIITGVTSVAGAFKIGFEATILGNPYEYVMFSYLKMAGLDLISEYYSDERGNLPSTTIDFGGAVSVSIVAMDLVGSADFYIQPIFSDWIKTPENLITP